MYQYLDMFDNTTLGELHEVWQIFGDENEGNLVMRIEKEVSLPDLCNMLLISAGG